MPTPTVQFERYRHLSAVVHARDWLLMRARFGLAPNTIDAYARSPDSYFAFAPSTGIDREKVRGPMLHAGYANLKREVWQMRR
jgi:hypothetical protein